VIFQEPGSDVAMQWTNRALDYALELGDEARDRLYAHAEAMIATEGELLHQGLGIADAALRRKDH